MSTRVERSSDGRGSYERVELTKGAAEIRAIMIHILMSLLFFPGLHVRIPSLILNLDRHERHQSFLGALLYE